jgi:hypothetical protein
MSDTQTTTLPVNAGQVIGGSGTIIQSGHISGEEYNRQLVGVAGLRIFDIMRRSDTTIRRTLQICKLPILASTKDVVPGGDSDEAAFRARYVKRELMERNVKYKSFERECLSFFDFGHFVAEKTYELTTFEGRTLIGIKSLDSRKQTSIYAWETPDKKPGITQILITKPMVGIPREKLLVMTHDQEGENYEGTSLLRSAYKDWNIKDKLVIMNAIALEKLANGVPTLKKDGTVNVTPAEIAKVRAALRSLYANEEGFLEIPAGLIVEMLDLKASSNKDVLPTIQYHDRQIVGSVLAQFTELGSQKGSGGAHALSSDQTKLFMKSEEAADQIIVDAINEDLIKQICDLNWSDNDTVGYPKLVGGQISDEDVTVMADAVDKLMTAGALTAGIEIEQHLRKTMHLPEMTEDEIANYAEQQQQKADLAKAAAEAALNPPDPNNPKDPKADKTITDNSTKPATSKEKADLKAAAVVEASRHFRRQINVLFED